MVALHLLATVKWRDAYKYGYCLSRLLRQAMLWTFPCIGHAYATKRGMTGNCRPVQIPKQCGNDSTPRNPTIENSDIIRPTAVHEAEVNITT